MANEAKTDVKADEKPDAKPDVKPEEVKPKTTGYLLNWKLKGAGKLEPGKVYSRKSFSVSDAQFAALLANGTISEK